MAGAAGGGSCRGRELQGAGAAGGGSGRGGNVILIDQCSEPNEAWAAMNKNRNER